MKRIQRKLATLKRAAVIALWVGLSVRPGFAQDFLATGQTIPVQADKADGISGPVAVEDDGTSQLGLPLQYQDTGLTVIDLNTGLEWEKKDNKDNLQDPLNLHDADNVYRWSGNGTQETIWDWLDDVNAEQFAGHSDWRIPNIRELGSIVHYGRRNAAISTTFGPTRASPAYWSSTRRFSSVSSEWAVNFLDGRSVVIVMTIAGSVRAVRGGGQ